MVFDHSSRGSLHLKEWEQRGRNIFCNGKCEPIANFSATMVTSKWRERREVWREKWKVRVFGKGRCKLIANFSATMVTSLPFLSVSLSLSLSLSPNVPHAQYRKRFRASHNNCVGWPPKAMRNSSSTEFDWRMVGWGGLVGCMTYLRKWSTWIPDCLSFSPQRNQPELNSTLKH